MERAACIELRGVCKSFGRFTALDHLDLRVDKGEVVGLLGPNGSGKTTTLRIIAGLLQPDAGEILVHGQQQDLSESTERARIGYFPERNPLYESLTTLECLNFCAAAKGIAKPDRLRTIDRVVTAFMLSHVLATPVSRLSKGFRQRVGLAQACLGEPEILLFDEATNGLDPVQVVEARKMIQEASKASAVIFCSHLLYEVAALCSKVIILRDGQKQGAFSLRDAYGAPMLEVRVSEITSERAYVLLKDIIGVASVEIWDTGAESTFVCQVASGHRNAIVNQVADALLPHCQIISLGMAHSDLERRFINALTHNEKSKDA